MTRNTPRERPNCLSRFDPQHRLTPTPGGTIRDIALGLLQLTREFDTDIQLRVIVVDTNILLQDLGRLCRTGKQTTLLFEAEIGFVRLLVTPQIINEVNEHISRYAARTGISPEAMRSMWSEYQRALTVVAPQPSKSLRVRSLALRDPDDVPTAELTEVVAPSLALSDDKDLQDLGLAQKGNWLPYVLQVSRVVERDAINVCIRIGGAYLIYGFSEAAVGLAKAVIAVLRRIPKKSLLVIGASLATLFVVPRTRRQIAWWISSVIASGREVWPSVANTVEGLALALQRMSADWSNAASFLSENELQASGVPTNLRGYTIRVLAHSLHPLKPDEVLRRAKELGYKPRGAGSLRYLRNLLRRDPLFISPDGYEWKLSRSDATPDSTL